MSGFGAEGQTNRAIDRIRERLFSFSDKAFADFHAPLIPSVDRKRIIGVRTPVLRAFAKEICGTRDAVDFLKTLTHYYYEENNLHAFLIEQIRDFDECKRMLDEFLPFVDNWATCDMTSPRAFKKEYEKTERAAFEWISSDKIYTVRFGIVTLIKGFTAERFSVRHPQIIADIKSDEYYVNAAIGWHFATLATKRYADALPFFCEKKLNPTVLNLAVKKVTESRAVPNSRKEYLKSFKVKKP